MVKSAFSFALIVLLGLESVSASAQSRFDFRFSDEPDKMVPPLPMCLTDRQVREAIAQRGYTNISLNVANDERVQVRATQDGWVYLIDFNFCRDFIRGRQAIRPAG